MTLLWNADNTFGFDHIHWGRLAPRDSASANEISWN
jgi:hypothetical protein